MNPQTTMYLSVIFAFLNKQKGVAFLFIKNFNKLAEL